jgi:diacylglycerol kinase
VHDRTLTKSRPTAARTAHRLARRSRVLLQRIARSFYFASSGLGYLFRTQRNARLELMIGLLACAMAAWLGISRIEWAILVITIAVVLILEGLNTAMEAIVDLASPRVHPLARIAKDLAAGVVLLAAIGSIAVGLLILGPPLWQRWAG